MQQPGSAQLVTYFDPGIPPAPETSIDRALVQWSTLGEAAQNETLMIVHDGNGDSHVYGRAAIAEMIVTG